jgi:Protein of unknown function (DUF3995)
MATTISISLFLVFSFLGGLHFYWAFGGKWGLEAALPSNPKGNKVFTPNQASTIFVGFALLSMGIFVLLKNNPTWSANLPDFVNKWGLLGLAIVFLLRAMGDFRYAGFFKKIKGTTFADFDTRYYSPLCLFIGVLLLILHF